MKNINKDKDFLMFSGVVFFMVLIGFLWVLSAQNNFQIIKTQNKDNTQIKSDVDYIQDQLNRSIIEMDGQFDKINQALENSGDEEGVDTNTDVDKVDEGDKSDE